MLRRYFARYPANDRAIITAPCRHMFAGARQHAAACTLDAQRAFSTPSRARCTPGDAAARCRCQIRGRLLFDA
jgi:hypothetical protein